MTRIELDALADARGLASGDVRLFSVAMHDGCDHSADDRPGEDRSDSEWACLVRAAWSGPEPPSVQDVLAAAAAQNDDVLAEVISEDVNERRRRGLAWTLDGVLASVPGLMVRPAVRRVLLMAAIASDAGLGTSAAARAQSLRVRHPELAREIDALASLGGLITEVISNDDPLAPGDVRGKYILQERLGSGAFAETWRAADTVLGREVALKVISSRAVAGAVSERLLSEARSLARVRHDAVVTLHEAGRFTDGGEFYLDMELVQGDGRSRTLADLVRTGPSDGVAVAKLIAAVAHGLAAAHSRSVLHRDIKPSNILLDASQRPHLADFGLAVDFSGQSADAGRRSLAGTPAYIAPEVAAGQEATPLTDVYSLGATLRALLTGSDPRRDLPGGPREVLRRAAVDPLAPIRQMFPAVHPTLAAISDRATAHAPEDRYSSAAELAADLESFLACRPTAARQLSLIGRASLCLCRNRAVAAAVGLAVLVLAASSTAFVVGLKRERDAAVSAETRAKLERDAAVAARDVIQTQNRFISRAFNAARGRRGLGEAGADVTLGEALTMIDARVDSAFADRPLVLAATCQFLAQASTALGDFDAAERLGRRAESIRRELLGATDPDTIAARCTVASVLLTRRKLAEGHDLVLGIYEDVKSTDQMHTADGMWARLWKARVDEAQGRADAARAEIETLATEYRTAAFNGSMDRQTVLNDLVRHSLRAGDAAKTEAAQREIIELATVRLGAGDISTLNATRSLVSILQRRGAVAEAAELNAAILEKYRAILAPHHDIIFGVVLEQAQLELERGSSSAMPFAKEAAMRTAERSPGNASRLRAQIVLGRAQQLGGDLDAAKATLSSAFEIAVSSGASAGLVHEAGAAFEKILRAMNDADAAAEVSARVRALDARRRSPDTRRD